MRLPAPRLIWPFVIGAVLFSGVAQRSLGLDFVNTFWVTIAGILAVVVYLSTRDVPSAKSNDLETVAADLATALTETWQREAGARGLLRTQKMRVKWSALDGSEAGGADSARVMGHSQSKSEHVGVATEVAETFELITPKRLVILGAPGSGKTALLVYLMIDLLQKRVSRKEQGSPIPVLFPLASWRPRDQSLQTWMVDWLEQSQAWLSERTGPRGKTLAESLMENGRILPLLDGLDEIPEESRRLAAVSLASFSEQTQLPLALTCRADIYFGMTDRQEYLTNTPAFREIPEATVVLLNPVAIQDSIDYLEDSTPARSRSKWNRVRAEICLRTEGDLAKVLTNPLMLGLARRAYSETYADPGILIAPKMINASAIEHHLLDTMLDVAYAHERSGRFNGNVSPQQARRYLSWIADHMEQRQATQLSWWTLGTPYSRWWYWVVFGLLASVTALITFDHLVDLPHALLIAVPALLLGPICGLVLGVATPFEGSFSLSMHARSFANGFGAGLLLGFALHIWIGIPVATAFVSGAVTGVLGGLACAVEFVLEKPPHVEVSSTPRTSIESDRRALLIRVLGVAACGGSAIGFAIYADQTAGMSSQERVSLSVALALAFGSAVVVSIRKSVRFGLTCGLLTGVLAYVCLLSALSEYKGKSGELAVIIGVWMWIEIALCLVFTSASGAYAIVVAIRALNGQATFAFIDFLDDAHERGVLRQIGIHFEFVHGELQRRLAEK